MKQKCAGVSWGLAKARGTENMATTMTKHVTTCATLVPRSSCQRARRHCVANLDRRLCSIMPIPGQVLHPGHIRIHTHTHTKTCTLSGGMHIEDGAWMAQATARPQASRAWSLPLPPCHGAAIPAGGQRGRGRRSCACVQGTQGCSVEVIRRLAVCTQGHVHFVLLHGFRTRASFRTMLRRICGLLRPFSRMIPTHVYADLSQPKHSSSLGTIGHACQDVSARWVPDRRAQSVVLSFG